MKKLLIICQIWLAAAAWADAPPWNEIQAAVEARDFARLESWVGESGVSSTTAANILIAAARSGDQAMVDRFLALGISPNSMNINRVAPLLAVAQNGQTEMVRHLLQHGAKANTITYCGAADCKGHTPLLGAACKQDLQMTKMLLDAGADPRAADNAAIQTANTNGDVELFLLLKQFGAKEMSSHPLKESAQHVDSIPRSKTKQPADPVASLGLAELLPRMATAIHGAPAEPKSISRMATIADDANVSLADLLTVQLTAEPLLELVERQELAHVLSEQKLTRLFAADSANYAKIAGLLRADALLLINERTINKSKFIESRLIRVNPGLVLDTVYSPAPVADPEAWAELMGARVSGQAAKVIQYDAIALSWLNLRTSLSSSASQGLSRTLTVLLNDRLAHQSRFVLLDRDAMGRLIAEKGGQFWTSSFLVDGTLEPALNGSGAFSLSIRFQPTGQGEALIFTAAGNQADPAAAIDELLAKINARVTGSHSPVKRGLDDEARSYFDEAQWAFAAQQPALAQNAAETAWALGLRTLPVAHLRVLAAMRTLRDLNNKADLDFAKSSDCLDLGIQCLTIWRETLQSELIQGHPEDLRKWLEFGNEMIDIGILALVRVPTAAEQVRQAERLEALRNLIWVSLEETWIQSAKLKPDTGIGNNASEKQAAFVRVLFPRTSDFIPAARSLLSRNFRKDNNLTRAHIRSNMIAHWRLTQVIIQYSRFSGGSANLYLPPNDEASIQLANELRSSPAPEDRYVSALLAISTASLHQAATHADLDRLLASLSDMDKLLAQDDQVFCTYWERFKALDKLNGVPFFAINTTFSPDEKHRWDRNTAEHTEFRRQLYLHLCAGGKMPPSGFDKLVSLDQYTPEQKTEVLDARARLGAPSPFEPKYVVWEMPAAPSSEPGQWQGSPQPPGSSAPPLHVRRLWTPFNLGLDILPEFKGDFTSKTWSEGRIWLHGFTFNIHGHADRHYIFAIEPGSLRTETISIPESSSDIHARIIVTSTLLIFVDGNMLAVQNRANGHWDIYKEIHMAGATPPVLVGDSIYLIVAEPPGNALIGFNLKLRTTEVIASTRRRPATSPFDDPGIEIQTATSNEAGEIVVTAGSISQAWSPTQHTWRSLPPETSSTAQRPNLKPVSPEYGRIGTVGKAGGNVVLNVRIKDGPVTNIPVIFERQTSVPLPDSRYGPQNIQPRYCNSFPGGIILEPANVGSGFWIISQREIDDYLRR